MISVDTKKKELIGNYVNTGRQWRPAKRPRRVQGHDFPTPDVPRAYPYGIYDVGRNTGFVNLGTDHDTGSAVAGSGLRTLDALHLSSIEFLRARGQEIALASYDDRIIAAARLLAIPLFPLQ